MMWLRSPALGGAGLAKHLHIFVLGALVACVAAASAQTPRLPPLQMGSYAYEARTTQAARTQGNVNASGIAWACQGSVCSTRGPWPGPGVPACHALALQVGVIASYGRSGAMLTAAELAECNAGLAAPNVRLPSGVQITPTIPIRPSTPDSTAVVVNTPELSFVGGAAVDTSDRAAPAVTVNTSELSFVGGATVDLSDRDAPAVVVNTPELSFVGR